MCERAAAFHRFLARGDSICIGDLMDARFDALLIGVYFLGWEKIRSVTETY